MQKNIPSKGLTPPVGTGMPSSSSLSTGLRFLGEQSWIRYCQVVLFETCVWLTNAGQLSSTKIVRVSTLKRKAGSVSYIYVIIWERINIVVRRKMLLQFLFGGERKNQQDRKVHPWNRRIKIERIRLLSLWALELPVEDCYKWLSNLSWPFGFFLAIQPTEYAHVSRYMLRIQIGMFHIKT